MATLQASNPQQSTNAETGTTVTVTGIVVAAGTNRGMALVVAGEGDGTATQAQINAATYGGVALTQLARVERTDWSWVEIWWLANPAVGTASIVLTMSEADFMVIGVYVADDVNQTTPLRTAATSSGNAASCTATVGSVGANDLVLDILSIDSTGHAAAVGADQTERFDVDNTGNEGASSTQPGSAGGVMSWTWTTAAPFSFIATAFVHEAGGGTTHTLTPSDTMTMSDSLAKRVAMVRADPMALADALAKRYGLAVVDPMALADALSKRFGLPFGDTTTTTDQLAKRVTISRADLMALSDLLDAAIPAPPSGALFLRMWTGFGL